MGKTFEAITPELTAWIERQKLFFVSTAPLSEQGLINLSPKGMDSFRVLGEQEVAYVDLIGSGVETIAHLKENGRIVVMFCAFDGPPKIVRIHGKGAVVEPHDSTYPELISQFPVYANARAIIRVRATRISDSCGFGVPLYSYEKDRSILLDWAGKKGPEGLEAYKREKNQKSLDGLPGLDLG